VQSRVTAQFRKRFSDLPDHVQRAARAAYSAWKQDPFHTSLHFKPVQEGVWSVRIGLHWRAVAYKDGEDFTRFWIGSHADYDKLI